MRISIITIVHILSVLYIDLSTPFIVTKCCKQRKHSNTPCMSYDNNMMAETLDEAMFSFPNLASTNQNTLFSSQNPAGDQATMRGASAQTTSDQGNTESGPITPLAGRISISAAIHSNDLGNGGSSDCSTYACMSCKLSIVNGFLSNCDISQQDNATFTAQREDLVTKLGTTQGSCYNNSKRSTGFKPKKQTMKKNAQSRNENPLVKNYVLMKSLQNDVDDNTIDTQTTTPPPTESKASGNKSLGMVTNIECEYRRGNALNANSQWCGLCNLCWQWRKLPVDYYPNYINEVNCDHNDDGCLSGYGECKPIIRSINVMRKSGDDWQKVSIDTTTACECQVKLGTPLHELVMK